MKAKKLVLCILLSVALVVTFIPVISFGGSNDGASAGDKPAVEEHAGYKEMVTDKRADDPAPAKELSAKSFDDDWYLNTETATIRLAEDDYTYLYGWVRSYNPEIELEFKWQKGSTDLTDWDDLVYKDEDGDLFDKYEVSTTGTYYFVVREKDDTSVTATKAFVVEGFSWEATADNSDVSLEGGSKTLTVVLTGDVPDDLTFSWVKYEYMSETSSAISGANSNTLTVSTAGGYECAVCETDADGMEWYQYVWFEVYDYPDEDWQTVYINGIKYELNDRLDAAGAGVWDYDDNVPLSGNISFLSSVKLSNGKVYPVTMVWTYLPKEVTSVTIPASVKEIHNIGFYYDEDDNRVPVPGFTVFGTTGSAAQAYAKENGLTFRDLAVEAAVRAEAARQGVYSGSMPAVKASKPKAAKKAITVKWKKLKKKQLKSGVSSIEVWVSTNTAFARGATIEKRVGKKKASVKIKGLKKGVTYYAKVRAIKYVNGQKVVGKWSGVKKIKVKK